MLFWKLITAAIEPKASFIKNPISNAGDLIKKVWMNLRGISRIKKRGVCSRILISICFGFRVMNGSEECWSCGKLRQVAVHKIAVGIVYFYLYPGNGSLLHDSLAAAF